LESYGGEVSHGKKLKIFGVTIWLTEFCQHFGIQIITPADTLSFTALVTGAMNHTWPFDETIHNFQPCLPSIQAIHPSAQLWERYRLAWNI